MLIKIKSLSTYIGKAFYVVHIFSYEDVRTAQTKKIKMHMVLLYWGVR